MNVSKKDRLILLLLISVELAFFILNLTSAPPLLKAILVLPSFYVIPGVILLTALRRDIDNVVKLTIEGFFTSTIMSVILTLIMLIFGLPMIPFTYSLIVFILVLFLSVIALIRKIKFKLSGSDSLLIAIAFSSYIALLVYFNGLPRLFTPDETSYIADMRDIVLKGSCSSWGSIFSSEIISLLHGRVFWLLFGASFLCVTGLPSYQLNLLSCMFLPMTALISSLLIPSNFKNRKILQIASAILTISNPLLIEFSGFVLNDLAFSFYTLFTVAIFVESLRIDKVGNASINLRGLALPILSILILILIKPNILFLFPLYIIIICFVLKHKLYKTRKYKTVLCILIIPILAYELIIDVPYVLVVWFGWGDEAVRHAIWAFTKPVITLGSPAEHFLGWFITTRWHRATIFSYDYFGYLNRIYRLLSPEALGLPFAGVGLGLPLILLLKEIRSNLQMRLITLFTSISLILAFFESLSNVGLGDINRYFLFIYPLIVVVSLGAFCVAFLEGNVRVLTVLIIPSVFLLQMSTSLSMEKDGVYIGYGLPKINWTSVYLLFQLAIYLTLVILMKNATIPFKLLSKHLFKLHLPKVLFLSFIASILLSNVYFSGVFFDLSRYFRDVRLKNLDEPLRGMNTSFILSNSFIYLRDFVSDEVYVNNYVLPLPMTKQELDYFISKGFNGTRIVVTEDPTITSYEYANAYKNKLLQGGCILPEIDQLNAVLPNPNVVGSGCVLNLVPNANQNSFDDASECRNNGTAYNTLFIEDEQGRNALLFNGQNSFVEFKHNSALNITDALTVRIWFRTSCSQSGRFLLEKGDPYSYGIYLTTNSTVLSFYVRLANKGVVFASFNGTFADNRLYDVVGVFDGRHVQLYVNGLLRANVDIGFNDTIVASSKPLWIGTWAKRLFFNGTIYNVQIYNRTLSSLEIQLPYLKDRPHARPIYEATSEEGGKILVYQVEGPIILHKSGSDISVNDVQVDISNYLLPVLKINVSSPRTANLTIIVGTLRFSKVLDAKIEVGNNSLEFPFEYELPDGRSYGFYVASKCAVIIMDEDGNIIYDDVLGKSQLTDSDLLVFMALLISIFILYVGLSWNIPAPTKAEKDSRALQIRLWK